MKIRRICLMLAALFCAGQLAQADILILKNGEKKEGTIIEEKPDAVRMKYKITPKIWDDKDFARSEIQQIIRQRQEEIEIVELRKLLPTEDMMSADQYEQIIQDKLRPFLNKYPGTPEAKNVEAIINEFQAEKDKVVAGQLKMEGQWLPAEMVKRDDYNIQAYKVRREMVKKAAEQDYTGSLRQFDRLSDLESGYPASLQYVKAIPEAIEIMTKYESALTKMLAEQPILQKGRDDSLKKLVEPDLGRTKAAVARDVSAWKVAYDAEKKSKVRWLVPYKYDLKSLQEALKVLVTERGKLQLIDLAKLEAQNEALTKSLRYLADENVIEAEAALKSAQAVGLKDSSRTISTLHTRIVSLKTQQAKTKNLNRTFGAGSTAVGAGTGAIQDDRVAQAMAAAEQTKEAKKADAEDADAKADEKKDASAKTKAKSQRVKAASDTATVAPVEESNTQTYMLMGAFVVIIILVGAMVMQKKKAK